LIEFEKARKYFEKTFEKMDTIINVYQNLPQKISQTDTR
jgi:hypothetical protein